jgi:hypothetical protein
VKVFKDLRQEDWSNAWQARFVEAAHRLIERIDAVLAAAGNFAGPAGLPDGGTRLSGLEGLAMIAALLAMAARHDLGFALSGKGGQALDDLGRALGKLEAYRAEKKKLSLAYSDAAIAAAEVETWKGQWRAAGEKIWPFGAFARRGVAARMKTSGGCERSRDPGKAAGDPGRDGGGREGSAERRALEGSRERHRAGPRGGDGRLQAARRRDAPG